MLMRMSPTSARHGLLRLAGAILVLLGAAVFLTGLGSGPLGTPSLFTPSAWGAWASLRDPITMVFALLRAATLAAAWYLLGVTVIGAAARAAGNVRLIGLADAL